jgi:hypothetical protein
MSYLDDNLPDFSTLSLPEDGLLFSDSSSAASPSASSGGEIGMGQAFSAGASVMAGVGVYMQGQEMAGADEYNASLELMEGTFNVEQIGMEEGSTLSTQKAMYAKSGVEQSGSVLDVALNTATEYEYSKQVANYNAQSAANMDNYEAAMAKSKGKMGLAEGILGAVGKLI